MYDRFGPEGAFGCHGHGGRRFMRGMFRGRMGGGRMFEQGALRLVILRLIADAPRHGYELIKEIEERLGGAYSPSPGVIYPTLTLLEEQELIRQEPEEGGKKRYAITGAGRKMLEENAHEIEALFARMEEAGAGGAGRAQLFRAMHNVRTALRLRLARGRLTEEELRKIVAALDAAAQEIERS